jgi:hypothetical protein
LRTDELHFVQAQRIANKSTVFFQPRKAFQLKCILLPRKGKFWNLSTKANQIDCVLPKNFGIANKHRIVFSCAAKIFGIYQQRHLNLTVFCSALQRKYLELVNKSNLNWIWNCEQKHCDHDPRALLGRPQVSGTYPFRRL